MGLFFLPPSHLVEKLPCVSEAGGVSRPRSGALVDNIDPLSAVTRCCAGVVY